MAGAVASDYEPGSRLEVYWPLSREMGGSVVDLKTIPFDFARCLENERDGPLRQRGLQRSSDSKCWESRNS